MEESTNLSKYNSIACIIPAKERSFGLPNKNMLKINNKPLVYYPINIAKKSKLISNKNIFVNTDSDKIIKYVNKLGNFSKFKRPKYLAKKLSLITDVILHHISWFEKKNFKYEHIVLLEPTSPLTNYLDVDRAINLYISKKAHSLVSISRSIREHTNFNYKLTKKNYSFKQQNPLRTLSNKLNKLIYIYEQTF